MEEFLFEGEVAGDGSSLEVVVWLRVLFSLLVSVRGVVEVVEVEVEEAVISRLSAVTSVI